MSRFTGALTLTHLAVDWRMWRLEQPLIYEVGHIGSGRVLAVPAGFKTDGASVPRALWAVLPAWGKYSRAAVIHDYLCVRLATGNPHPEAKSWAEAAAIFREAMKVLGVGLATRNAMWLAVRTWGVAKN